MKKSPSSTTIHWSCLPLALHASCRKSQISLLLMLIQTFLIFRKSSPLFFGTIIDVFEFWWPIQRICLLKTDRIDGFQYYNYQRGIWQIKCHSLVPISTDWSWQLCTQNYKTMQWYRWMCQCTQDLLYHTKTKILNNVSSGICQEANWSKYMHRKRLRILIRITKTKNYIFLFFF